MADIEIIICIRKGDLQVLVRKHLQNNHFPP